MAKVTINLPTAHVVRRHADGDIILDFSKLPEAIINQIVTVGAQTILTNTWNGAGKEASDGERRGMVEKKIGAWMRGEWSANGGARGDAFSSLMKEAYIEAVVALTGASPKKVDESMAALVKSTFGEKEANRFPRFLDAKAKAEAKRDGTDEAEVRAALEEKWTAAANALAAERSKVADKLDLTSIDV